MCQVTANSFRKLNVAHFCNNTFSRTSIQRNGNSNKVKKVALKRIKLESLLHEMNCHFTIRNGMSSNIFPKSFMSIIIIFFLVYFIALKLRN